MQKKSHITFFIFLLFFLLFKISIGQKINISAALDSTKIRIGEQVKLDLYVSYSAKQNNLKIQWPNIADTITDKIEVISVSVIDTTSPDKSNPDIIQQHQQITISAYDSGYFAIPGFKFFINNDDTTSPDKSNPDIIQQHQQITISAYDSGYFAIPGFKFFINNDSTNAFYSQSLFLEVHTVPTDSSITKTKDIKPPFAEAFNWKWYSKYFYWGFSLLVIIILIVLITIYFTKKNKIVVLKSEKPKIPAHIIALQSLEKIKNEQIWKEEKTKEYYSSISDTIRLYIEERFKVNALESTTAEIMKAFRSQVVDKESKDKLQQLLMLSDLVKFAKQFPIISEHTFTLQNAFDFVNETKREEKTIIKNDQQINSTNS